MENKCLLFLRQLFGAVGGRPREMVDVWEFGEQLGLTRDETDDITEYLRAEGLIEFPTLRGITVSHAGRKHVLRLLQESASPPVEKDEIAMKPKVFIGSSTEGLDIAYPLQKLLDHDAEVTVWDQGIFGLSEYILTSLLDVLKISDFGVFILSPDDVVKMRGKEHQATRDNVIFELGLFFGGLGKDRVFFVMPRGVENFHLPTDLIGMNPATYDPHRQDQNIQAALGPVKHDILKAIQKIGPLAAVTPASPVQLQSIVYDEGDIIGLLRDYMDKKLPLKGGSILFKYVEADQALGLPPGTAARYMERAATEATHHICERGGNTILLARRIFF